MGYATRKTPTDRHPCESRLGDRNRVKVFLGLQTKHGAQVPSESIPNGEDFGAVLQTSVPDDLTREECPAQIPNCETPEDDSAFLLPRRTRE
jgi:hypothetical protein